MQTKYVFTIFFCGCVWLGTFCPTGVLAEEGTTTFAAIIPLSGNGAEHGLWIKRGLELARDNLRAQSQSAPVLVFEDSQGQNTLAISALRKVSSTHDIAAVFSWGSGVALALSPIVNQARIVQMGV
ncbi:MAG: hypothetical protein KDD69_15500, partial [Bdellovibrionales bacterium]|nr:hypothetical protein [Bdellovibrionales bacterium]